ncbi:hypothetical protein CS022_12140 [Veronia nyctiphanis]|uniref:Uncharacterized protein n=1 Tax=Veronia nyctiphanis TaxID=1278244 RepID=A0A4Q0YR29_9GAMM|nr:hypothetical protein [Veronia nyctiphanis]RXJ73033.1 hypothetical protein CS022_12140 [Veronia nyctiphanis]
MSDLTGAIPSRAAYNAHVGVQTPTNMPLDTTGTGDGIATGSDTNAGDDAKQQTPRAVLSEEVGRMPMDTQSARIMNRISNLQAKTPEQNADKVQENKKAQEAQEAQALEQQFMEQEEELIAAAMAQKSQEESLEQLATNMIMALISNAKDAKSVEQIIASLASLIKSGGGLAVQTALAQVFKDAVKSDSLKNPEFQKAINELAKDPDIQPVLMNAVEEAKGGEKAKNTPSPTNML